jgi:FtsH-binding integral membrane protein
MLRTFQLGSRLASRNVFNSSFSGNQVYRYSSKVTRDRGHKRESEVTALQDVRSDVGKWRFMKKVYTLTGAGMLGSFGTATIIDMTEIASNNSGIMLIGGSVLALGSIFFTGTSTSYWLSVGKQKIKNTVASLTSMIGYSGVSFGMGMVMSPLVTMYNDIDPTIVPTAIGLSALTFAGSSMCAYMRPKGSLLFLGPPMMAALTGFVGMSIISLGSTMIMGPNILSDIWTNVDMYGGLGMFTVFIAYDTHYALNHYNKEENPDHVQCALHIYLDLVNVFIRMMEIIAKSKQ